MIRPYRFIAIASSLILLTSCSVSAPISEDYYAGTDKIAGGKAPSVPVVTFTKTTLRADFTASIDPDSNSEVATYIIYVYRGVPKTYYQARDIDNALSSPTPRAFSLPGLSGATGTFTVVLTGYDGYRESPVTDQNRITFTLP